MSRQLYMQSALVIALVFIVIHQYGSALPPSATGASHGSSALPKLFQFDHYKSMFKKSYANLAEELSRKKIFLAKAFRAFVSGVAYKFKKTSYFLALNQLSDRTKYEIRKTKTLRDPTADLGFNTELHDEEKDTVLESEEDVLIGVENVKEIASEKGESEIVDELDRLERSVSKNRRKRSLEGDIRRDFSLDQLVDRTTKVEVPPKVKNKIDSHPVSNNPNYEPPEMISMGSELPARDIGQNFRESLVKIFPFGHKSDERNRGNNPVRGLHDLLEGMSSAVSHWVANSRRLNNAPELEEDDIHEDDGTDKIFFDHSQEGCMFAPRDQLECGACYAFAVTAFFEWLHCKKTGKLVAFSEQYLVDCGPEGKFKESLDGCDGGVVPKAAEFYQVYGMEIASKYPYRASQGTCPYDVNNEKSMGYLRFHGNPSRYFQVSMRAARTLIKYAPVVILVGSEGDFAEYGGGVHTGEQCCKANTCEKHAVLLVGHGRQDGEEYWLIRNSYSTAWGENGYYKLNKKSKCIISNVGLTFATDDGKRFDLQLAANKTYEF